VITRRAKDATLPICSSRLESQFVFCFDIAPIGLTLIQSHAAFQTSPGKSGPRFAGAEYSARASGSLIHNRLNVAGAVRWGMSGLIEREEWHLLPRNIGRRRRQTPKALLVAMCGRHSNCNYGGPLTSEDRSRTRVTAWGTVYGIRGQYEAVRPSRGAGSVSHNVWRFGYSSQLFTPLFRQPAKERIPADGWRRC